MGGIVEYAKQQNLSTAALALPATAANCRRTAVGWTPALAHRRRIDLVTLKAASAITQDITVTLNSAQGSAYDVVLDSVSLSAATDYAYKPAGDVVLGPGDQVTLACTANASPNIVVSGAILLEE